MIHDRYGHWESSRSSELLEPVPCTRIRPGSQSSLPCLQEPAAGAITSAAPIRDGPIPETEYPDGSDELRLYQEAEKYYDGVMEERRGHVDEANAAIGEAEFQLGDSLRMSWMTLQRADRVMYHQFQRKPEDLERLGFRVARDGVMERRVSLPPPINQAWVPVVPDGQATANLSWKRWLFLQCHVGILGGHRSADKTTNILKRQCWWPTMAKDVERWCSDCLTCMRFRKMPRKQEQVAVIPTNRDCWQEVIMPCHTYRVVSAH